MIALHIVFQNEDGRAVSAVKVSDRSLLLQAAKRAIHEARDRARSIRKVDALLGRYQLQEADHIERMLASLIPELRKQKEKSEFKPS